MIWVTCCASRQVIYCLSALIFLPHICFRHRFHVGLDTRMECGSLRGIGLCCLFLFYFKLNSMPTLSSTLPIVTLSVFNSSDQKHLPTKTEWMGKHFSSELSCPFFLFRSCCKYSASATSGWHHSYAKYPHVCVICKKIKNVQLSENWLKFFLDNWSLWERFCSLNLKWCLSMNLANPRLCGTIVLSIKIRRFNTNVIYFC